MYQLFKNFITRMSFGDILFDVPIVLRRLFRKLESMEKRLMSNKWSTTFNKVCLEKKKKYIYISRIQGYLLVKIAL